MGGRLGYGFHSLMKAKLCGCGAQRPAEVAGRAGGRATGQPGGLPGRAKMASQRQSERRVGGDPLGGEAMQTPRNHEEPAWLKGELGRCWACLTLQGHQPPPGQGEGPSRVDVSPAHVRQGLKGPGSGRWQSWKLSWGTEGGKCPQDATPDWGDGPMDGAEAAHVAPRTSQRHLHLQRRGCSPGPARCLSPLSSSILRTKPQAAWERPEKCARRGA